jgi:hypothetical protein
MNEEGIEQHLNALLAESSHSNGKVAVAAK